MKKVLYILFTIILTLVLIGCAKIIKTETEVVEAIIVEVDRDPMRKIGNTFRPADYDILIKYKDVETWIDVSLNEYRKYKDLIGTIIEANFIIDYYDDNSIKKYLKLAEE